MASEEPDFGVGSMVSDAKDPMSAQETEESLQFSKQEIMTQVKAAVPGIDQVWLKQMLSDDFALTQGIALKGLDQVIKELISESQKKLQAQTEVN